MRWTYLSAELRKGFTAQYQFCGGRLAVGIGLEVGKVCVCVFFFFLISKIFTACCPLPQQPLRRPASSTLIAPTPCATSPPSRGRISGRGDNEFEPQKVVTPVVAPVDVVSAGGRTLFVRVTVKDKRGERREQYDMNDDIARAKKKTKKTVDVSPHIEECASPLLDDVGQQPRGKSPEETDMLQELASMAFSTTHSVVKADSKVADEVLSMVKQMMNKLLLFVLLEDNEYLVSNFVRVIHALSIFVGIVLNCLSLMKSFLSFPIDDHFLTKDEIVSEGQLR